MDYTKQIDVMTHNLLYIRKSIGMSAAEFGGLIGITRQTINNIEHGRNKMTQTMYMAFMYALEKIVFMNCSDAEREMIERLLNEKVVECDYKKSPLFEEGS